MIDIQSFRQSNRIAEKTIAELASVKPFVINRLVQRLINNRLIEAPYPANTGKYHTEEAFIEIAKNLKISDENFDRVMLCFRQADEANQ